MERSLYPNLKLTMYRSGIRQNRLARTIGMNEASLSRIMNGTREPGLEVQQHIANVLQENAEWLFQRTVSQETRVLVSSGVGIDEGD